MSLLWVDTETSGLSPYRNGVLSLAGFHEAPLDEDTFSYETCPHVTDKIEDAALKVNGYTREQILEFPAAPVVIEAWESYLTRYVNPYDSSDKLTLAGYNVGFDARFLLAWFRKHKNNYFNSYFSVEHLDVLPLVKKWRQVSRVSLPNNKLTTVAEHFGISGQFHTALDDIKATYQVYQAIKEYV